MSDDAEREQNRQWLIANGHVIHLRFYIDDNGSTRYTPHFGHADCGERGEDVVTTDRASEVTCEMCLSNIKVAVDFALERGTI